MVTEGRSRPYARLRSLRKQEGAAALYGLVTAVSSLAATALAVDIGQLYYAQRDLQKMASDAALEAARAQSGCYNTDGRPGLIGAAQTAVDTALTRDLPFAMKDGAGALPSLDTVKQSYGFGVSTVEYGMVGMANDNAGTRTRAFTALDPNSPAVDSVRVNLARPSPTLLVPFITLGGTAPSPAGTVLLRASAAAQQSPVAAFRIGSQLASVNATLLCALVVPAPQPVGNVDGSAACTTAAANLVTSSEVANASVTIGQIAAAAGTNDIGNLLNRELPLQDQLKLLSDTLGLNGLGTGAAAIGSIAALAGSSRTVSLGTILGIDTTTTVDVGSAINTLPINALDLLNSLALDANKGLYPVSIPISTTNLPPGVNVSVFLTLGQGESGSTSDSNRGSFSNPTNTAALGRSGFDANGNPRTVANAQQVSLFVRFQIDPGQIPALAPLLATAGSGAKIKVGVDVNAAAASATLDAVKCPTLSGQPQPRVGITATTSPANLRLGTYGSDPKQKVISGDLLNVSLPLGGGVQISLDKVIPLDFQGGTTFMERTGPFDGKNPPTSNATFTVGAADVDLDSTADGLTGGISGHLSINATAGGRVIGGPITLPTGTILPVVDQSISGIVSGVLKNTIDPLLKNLGVGLGGATVTVMAFQPGTNASIVSTASPVLFTRAKPGIEVAPNPTVEAIVRN